MKVKFIKPSKLESVFLMGTMLGMVVSIFTTLFGPIIKESIPMVIGVAIFILLMLLILWVFGEEKK